ncbi:ribulose-phosphate 3-epimerase [Myxococcota bacterium]|nr:ribulose-phosphate 3-epimerase [Myxococcota bacterium]
MTRPIKIAPSILACDFTKIGAEIKKIETAGADCVHVDVMDGHFVPNLTIGPPVVESIRKITALPLDVHLMIQNPERFIESFVKAGADTVGVHIEACPHVHRTIRQIKETGTRASITLNPGTPAQAIEPVLEEIDQVLVMTVNPGFGGQKFIEGCLKKITAIRAWLDEKNVDVDVEVDGGIDPATAGLVAKAGANVLVAGTAIFGSSSYPRAIEGLRQEAERAREH